MLCSVGCVLNNTGFLGCFQLLQDECQFFCHFQTTTAGFKKTAEISAVFQQCFHSNDFGVVSAVFQQFQSFFITGCKKTAEISAIFLQPALVVWKRPKFRPFSYNPKCFGRFPTTAFRPFSNNAFRPFSYKFSAVLQLIPYTIQIQSVLTTKRASNLNFLENFSCSV